MGRDRRGARPAPRRHHRALGRGHEPRACWRRRPPTTRSCARGSRASSASPRAPARRAGSSTAARQTDVRPALGVDPRADARPASHATRSSSTCATAREYARRIPGAQLVELPGVDSLPSAGDTDAVLGEIEEFLTGGRRGGEQERALLTVLFTDIVGSTARAAQLGDKRWRDLLAVHDTRGAAHARALRRRRHPAHRRRLPRRSSTARRAARCAAPARCARSSRRTASTCASGCTRASARSSATTSAGWRSTSPRASARSPRPARSLVSGHDLRRGRRLGAGLRLARRAPTSRASPAAGRSSRWSADQAMARTCVIGAGGSGLVAAKVLLADGHDVVVYERARPARRRVGAVARVSRACTRRRPGAQFQFSDFPFAAGLPDVAAGRRRLRLPARLRRALRRRRAHPLRSRGRVGGAAPAAAGTSPRARRRGRVERALRPRRRVDGDLRPAGAAARRGLATRSRRPAASSCTARTAPIRRCLNAAASSSSASRRPRPTLPSTPPSTAASVDMIYRRARWKLPRRFLRAAAHLRHAVHALASTRSAAWPPRCPTRRRASASCTALVGAPAALQFRAARARAARAVSPRPARDVPAQRRRGRGALRRDDRDARLLRRARAGRIRAHRTAIARLEPGVAVLAERRADRRRRRRLRDRLRGRAAVPAASGPAPTSSTPTGCCACIATSCRRRCRRSRSSASTRRSPRRWRPRSPRTGSPRTGAGGWRCPRRPRCTRTSLPSCAGGCSAGPRRRAPCATPASACSTTTWTRSCARWASRPKVPGVRAALRAMRPADYAGLLAAPDRGRDMPLPSVNYSTRERSQATR